MLSQRHVQCPVLWHVRGEGVSWKTRRGWDFQFPLYIISRLSLTSNVSCKRRKWRKSHNADIALVSFLLLFTTGYCFCLTQTCIYIVDGTKWLLCPQCDLQVLFLTHLLLYHYITVYHFHFEIYLARSTMPSYLWHISALKTSIREGGQMALVPGVIIIIPRSRHFVTSAGVSVCARTRTIWRWPLRHPGLDNLNNNFTPSRSFKTIFFRSRVYICHSTAGEHHLDVVHMCQNVSGTN